MRLKMRRKWIFLAPLGVLAIVLFIAIGGESVLLLWNWLLPPLFGWHEITFWQALGILALCRILFGGWGGPGGHRSGMRRRMEERCEQMTPEERERFRQGIRGRWGFGVPPTESDSKAQ
jgi:hypothetical protein